MIRTGFRLLMVALIVLLSVDEAVAQPVWMKGTPSIVSVGALSVTMNYGLDRTGIVYVVVYNFENLTIQSSLSVKTRALQGPGGNIVATRVIPVSKTDIRKVLRTVIDVVDPQQIHTLYIVAEDSRSTLQRSPVRLTATTLSCQPADAGPGGNECDLTFALNAVPTIGTGIWSVVNGPGEASFSPSAGTPNAIVTVTSYGSYTFRWTETRSSCSSFDDINVSFYEKPAATVGSGGDACGPEYTLRAVISSIYQSGVWSMTSGSGSVTFSPSATSPTAVATVSEYGTKVFTWTMTNGNCTISLNTVVNFYQQPVANAGTGGSICGLKLTMDAVPSTGTGLWTKVSGPGTVSFRPDARTFNTVVSVSSYGNYVFRWTETNGPCKSSDDISVSFLQELAADGGNGGEKCGLEFQLNANPGTGPGTWTKVGGPGNAAFTPDAHSYNAIVTVTESGAYDFEWSVVSNNCSSADIVRVTFYPEPMINAGQDMVICNGNSTTLHASGTGSFRWIPEGSLNDPSSADPVASPSVTTVYTVTITDLNGCTNSDQVKIEVREKPESDAGPDQTIDYTFETNLNGSPVKPGETGEWKVLYGAGTFADKNDPGTKVSGLIMGENAFVWTVSGEACSNEGDTVIVMVNDLRLPSMITPNLDGKNDFFDIRGRESLGTIALHVFNRWGALVYSSNDYRNDWDGRDNSGTPLQDDTYFYIINPEKRDMIKGYVVIKK